MRIAVTGATGNVGTAVLSALGESTEVTSVLGIARRLPDLSASPYADCRWEAIDIAAASDRETAVRALADAFADADAVIHLAWLIQPNDDRDLLRRVNVEGTARVAEAAAAAGVSHLVVASSVGAYRADRSTEYRDESWPTGGISTSHYSVDKAAQECVLDEFSAQHPEIIVARLRPALSFAEYAASEIQRLFLGSWMPLQLLHERRLPILPLPAGLRGVQTVHSLDVGRAYASAVLRRAEGAFNICADDTLSAGMLAELLDHGRIADVPVRVVRTGLTIGHRVGLVAADEGWLDMGMRVPLMDNSRAKRELEWQPEHSAGDAVRALLEGLVDGRGGHSVPLRARDLHEHVDRQEIAPPRARTAEATPARAAVDRPPAAVQRSERIDWTLLGHYLSDHLTGATAGTERIERMAADFVDTPVYATLSELADQIRQERALVLSVMEVLDLPRRPLADAVAWIGERVGRLKANGRVLQRSPMTLLLETELMRSAVAGKIGMWQTLRDNADEIGLSSAQFEGLVEDSLDQLDMLGSVHEYARQRTFRTDCETFDHDSAAAPVRSS